MAESTKKNKLDKLLKCNSNRSLVSELKTIGANATAESLTEAQKVAFLAMMRMVHDPSEHHWKKRKEKLAKKALKLNEDKLKNQQTVAENSMPPRNLRSIFETTRRDALNKKQQRSQRLSQKIKKMRAEAKFPTVSVAPADRFRRYGYIPTSQRQQDLSNYSKL